MKEILSYWDVSLGLIAIGFGIFKWIKFEKYKKKRNQQMLKNGRYKISYARFRSDSLSYSLCYLIITAGIIFIYNRLNGNLPNIIELIKEFASYWIKIMGIV